MATAQLAWFCGFYACDGVGVEVIVRAAKFAERPLKAPECRSFGERRTLSSVVEHILHTDGVAGSKPAASTTSALGRPALWRIAACATLWFGHEPAGSVPPKFPRFFTATRVAGRSQNKTGRPLLACRGETDCAGITPSDRGIRRPRRKRAGARRGLRRA